MRCTTLTTPVGTKSGQCHIYSIRGECGTRSTLMRIGNLHLICSQSVFHASSPIPAISSLSTGQSVESVPRSPLLSSYITLPSALGTDQPGVNGLIGKQEGNDPAPEVTPWLQQQLTGQPEQPITGTRGVCTDANQIERITRPLPHCSNQVDSIYFESVATLMDEQSHHDH